MTHLHHLRSIPWISLAIAITVGCGVATDSEDSASGALALGYVPTGCLDQQVLQGLWVGRPGFAETARMYWRICNVVNNTVDWTCAWSSPSSMATVGLAGRGAIHAQTSLVEGTSMKQIVWVGGFAYERGVPLTVAGEPDFGAATTWVGHYDAASIGLPVGATVTSQSYATNGDGTLTEGAWWTLPNGTVQGGWRIVRASEAITWAGGIDRSVPWGVLPASTVPGRGPVRGLNHALVRANLDGSSQHPPLTTTQGYFRGGEYFYRLLGAPIDWNVPFIPLRDVAGALHVGSGEEVLALDSVSWLRRAPRSGCSPASDPSLTLRNASAHPQLFSVPIANPDAGAEWPAKRWKAVTGGAVTGNLVQWGWSGPGLLEGDPAAKADLRGRPGRDGSVHWRTAYYGLAPANMDPVIGHEWGNVVEVEWWSGRISDGGDGADDHVYNYVYGWNGVESGARGLWLGTASSVGPFDGAPYPGIPNDRFQQTIPLRARVGGRFGRDTTGYEASFFVPNRHEGERGSAERTSYCDRELSRSLDRTAGDIAYRICLDAPALREVIQVYAHDPSAATFGCEHMIYAFGYPTATGRDEPRSRAVANHFRNGELKWGTWTAFSGPAPTNPADAAARCPWPATRVLSYSGVYKVGQASFLDRGDDSGPQAWVEMREGAQCSTDLDCARYDSNGLGYSCQSNEGVRACECTSANCP